tara:strand:+ start:97 stop:258 length:162 start_codon:yes stop_codon:yes gene_type:complete
MINREDINIAIDVLNYKMRILSEKFRKDDGGWINEKAYIQWAKLKDAKMLLIR